MNKFEVLLRAQMCIKTCLKMCIKKLRKFNGLELLIDCTYVTLLIQIWELEYPEEAEISLDRL